MKKVLILALALFLNTSLCLAKTCEGLDGRCTEYYAGTKLIKTKYKLKNGKIEGKYREYYQNKNIKTLANYREGILEGKYFTYYDNLQIKTEEFYKGGRKHSINYLYNPYGKVLNTTTYYYGKKQGYSYDYLENTKIEKYYDNDELSFQKEYSYDGLLLEEKRYFKNSDKKITKYYYSDFSEHFEKYITSNQEREQLAEVFQTAKYMSREIFTSIKSGTIIDTANFYDDSNRIFYTYKSTEMQGEITSAEEFEYDENSHLIMKKEFTNNFKKMKFIKYYPNGAIDSQGQFLENPATGNLDVKNGNFYKYNKTGGMVAKTIYKNGKEIESFIWNYHPNGQYSFTGRLKNGEPDGLQTLYYDNGKAEKKSYFVSGRLHGESTSYTYEGEKTTVEHYTNGVLNGQKRTYYRNGNTKTESILKNGKLEGPTSSYYENGNLESKGRYLNNKGNGHWIKYYPNGAIEADCMYKDGKKHGVCKKYWENGNYSYIDMFENDTLKSRKAFDANGAEIWSQKY